MSNETKFDPIKILDTSYGGDSTFKELSPESKKDAAVAIALDLIRAEVSSSANTGADLDLNLSKLETYRDQILAALD